MIQADELEAWCDAELDPGHFSDYCPNGLQVEGTRPVRRLATGVTACQALLDAALARDVETTREILKAHILGGVEFIANLRGKS